MNIIATDSTRLRMARSQLVNKWPFGDPGAIERACSNVNFAVDWVQFYQGMAGDMMWLH